VVAQSVSYDRERVIEQALDRLAPGPEDAVLELGCGSGHLVTRVATRLRRGFVAGVEPSELMVRHARYRARRWIERGRAAIVHADSSDLGVFPQARFDRVIGVHVVCFWTEPCEDLAEVRRVLRPGGGLVLGFRPEPLAAARSGGRDPVRVPVAQVEGWLARAGFGGIRSEVRGEAARPLAWVVAQR
jgi:ubiquinone/menaquinone biosynthesis C-methylase UbiE